MVTAYYDGQFININSPSVHIEDRGYQFGDGIYEVVRIYQNKPWLWDDHMARLNRSANYIDINLPWHTNDLFKIFQELQKINEMSEAALYLQITRGVAPRGHWVKDPIKPVLVMTLRNVNPPSEELRQSGVKAITMPDERWDRCHIKSLNLLPNILAKKEAQKRGAYETLFIMKNSEIVTEGSSSNVFVVKDGTCYTHPEAKKILSGITRNMVIKIGKELSLPVREETFSRDFMLDADEVFLTSTTAEVLAITSIDEKPVGNGLPGPIVHKIYARYLQAINNWAETDS